MIIMMVIIALTPGDMTGFWHSEQDLDDGYEICYFFWENGEYAYLESIEDGMLYTGIWELSGEQLILDLQNAMLLDGRSVNIRLQETTMTIHVPGGKMGRMLLDGQAFYLLDRDPDMAILSLMPTYGMSESQADAFSTYD